MIEALGEAEARTTLAEAIRAAIDSIGEEYADLYIWTEAAKEIEGLIIVTASNQSVPVIVSP